MNFSLKDKEYKVSISMADNRILFVIKKISEEDVAVIYDFIKKRGKYLKKGFTVVNDVTGYNPVNKDAQYAVKNVQELLSKIGVSKIARVVNKGYSGSETHGIQLDDGTFDSITSGLEYLNEHRRSSCIEGNRIGRITC